MKFRIIVLAILLLVCGNSFAQQLYVDEGGVVELEMSGTFPYDFLTTLDNASSTAAIHIYSGYNVVFTGSFSDFYGFLLFEDNSSMSFEPGTPMSMAAKFRIGGGAGTQKAILKGVGALNNHDVTNNTNPVILDLFGELDLSQLTGNLSVTYGNIVFNNPSAVNAPKIKFSSSYKIIFLSDGCGFSGNLDVSKNFDFSQISDATFASDEVLFAKTKSEPVLNGTPNTSHLSSDYNYSVTKTLSGSNWELKLVRTSALPVELVSFKSSIKNGNVILNWETSTERNNYGFEIERKDVDNGSITGWQQIGFINGAGNANSKHSYSFTDKDATTGVYYYRLKQIDNDGKFNYSEEIKAEPVNIISGYSLQQNYPNPYNPSTVINYSIPENGKVVIKVYDVPGNEIATLVNEEKEAGSYQVTFDAGELAGGVYFYKIISSGFSETRKMILIK